MKQLLAAAILSTASLSAMAADQGFYANVDAGQISFTGGANSSFWPKPSAITLGGGYHFNRNLGVEAGYSIVGNSTVDTIAVGSSSTDTMKTKLLQVVAVGTYPINDKFELFGKLGLVNEQFDNTYSYSTPGTTYSVSNSASKTNLTYGIGGQFNINKRFGIRMQYQDFGKATFSNCTGNCEIGATSISAGGVYNF
jgi:OOP family OmpA-OmpF porin